jgi:hypothetical protein
MTIERSMHVEVTAIRDPDGAVLILVRKVKAIGVRTAALLLASRTSGPVVAPRGAG